MDINELKTEHPALFNTIIAESMSDAMLRERERISALLPKSSSDPRTQYMLNCIRDGIPVDNNVRAHYSAFAIRAASSNDHETQLVAALEDAFNVGKY